MAATRKSKSSLSNRLLSLLGIKYVQEEGNSTTVMTSKKMSELQDGMVIPKQLLERYQIQRSLGFGGYGSVFLARDFIIGRLVALKILNKTKDAGDTIYNHFIQEARIAGQLDHENIVVIYNVEEYEKCACIVMEYLAEGNLAGKIHESPQGLNFKEALVIISGILQGLSVAHKMKVVHRDIKPENILFDPKNRPKISDFGIAHIPKEQGGVHSSNEYKPVGTPAYMAPEQLKGMVSIDQRADLYSVGMIFYEMLVGTRPYNVQKEMTFDEIYRMVEQKEYTPVVKIRQDVPPQLSALIDRLLQVKPEDRFFDAKEVLQELKIFIQEESNEEKVDYKTNQFFTSPESLLEDVMRLLLVDGMMSPAERRELTRRAERLKVGAIKAREIENKIRQEYGLPSVEILEEYQATVALLGNDGHFSSEEAKILEATSSRMGIHQVERLMIEKDTIEQSKKRANK